MKIICTGLVMFALAATAAVSQTGDQSAWWKDYVANARLVTLPDGKKLGLFCQGKGTPVVMMEGGLSPIGIIGWRKVQAAIGRVTKACAYDRAGIWNSVPTDGPRDAGAEADDLAALLKAAHLPAPYVIVAHCYGGYIARLYAGRHTQDMAGLVLIDPSEPHQRARTLAALPALGKLPDLGAWLKDCAIDPRPAEFVSKCQRAVPDDVPPNMAERYRDSQTPAAASAMMREGAAMEGLSSQLLDTEKKSLGAMPLVLLNRDPTMPFPELVQESVGAQRGWLQMHVETMDLSSDSQLIVVPHAGHNIQIDRPDAVITAVTGMVQKARAARK